MANWYFKKNNQKVGPLNDAQMRQVARDGMIGPNDPVWREGLKEWVPASKIKGLFPATEGMSAMATIQEPMQHGIGGKPAAPPQGAVVGRPSGRGLPAVEIFEPSAAQATGMPTVMAKPIGETHHKVTISHQQHTAPPQASPPKPYEPPPLPPEEKPAPAQKRSLHDSAVPAKPSAQQVKLSKAEPPAAEQGEEPVNVEVDDGGDIMGDFKEDLAGMKTVKVDENTQQGPAKKDIEELAENALADVNLDGDDEEAGAGISEKDLFPSEAEEKSRAIEDIPAGKAEQAPAEDLAGGEAEEKPKPGKKAAGKEKEKLSKKAKPESKQPAEESEQAAESPRPRPGIGLALAACAIGLLSAVPAASVVYFVVQGAPASLATSSPSSQTVLENYQSAILRECQGGIDTVQSDWRVLIGLAGILTVLVGLLALVIKGLRKTAAAIFILLALGGLAGHVTMFQVPVCTAGAAPSVHITVHKPAVRQPAKAQPAPGKDAAPSGAVPATQPQTAPAATEPS